MIDVLVIRHGIAVLREDAERFGLADENRPLTGEGRAKMKRNARGIARRVPDVTALFSSPLRRAVETAELLESAYSDLEHVETDALVPDAPVEAVLPFLRGTSAEGCIAVVGHEPQLSAFVGHCLTGSPRSFVELKKGGACLIRFEEDLTPGGGRLSWLLTPKVLRKL
ncbi:MAG TPA: histidine phosphatase family protein [Polyangiaceae bacterium]|nr:histidine phosphatase family protein [Polyangiaceae bacterium]